MLLVLPRGLDPAAEVGEAMATKKKKVHHVPHPSSASLFDRLKFDPVEHPDARALVGYVRRGSGSKSLHLYPELDLHDYLEIQLKDVLDRKPYGRGERETRTVLWLEGSALVREVHVSRLDAQAQFLSGRLAEQSMQPLSDRSSSPIWQAMKEPPQLTSAPSSCMKC